MGGATASSTANAYAGLGCGANALIDQRLTSTWSTDLASRQPVVIQLPRPVDVSEIDIDPGAGCGDDDFSSMRGYKVETSATSASVGFTTWATGNFSATNNHKLNPLPGSATAVQWVKVTPMTAQGGSFVDLSEIGVYGRAHLDPPETTITSGPDGIDSDSTPTFTFASDQSDATFECRLDAAAYAACPSPYTAPTLSGAHSFDVRAVNANGEPDASPAHRSFTIDTSLPQIATGPSGITNSANATFTLANATNAMCRWDGEPYGACVLSRQGLTDGTHTFDVTTAGYPDDPTSSRTWTVDTKKPVLTVGGSAAADVATFTFSATDLTSVKFTCSLDGGPVDGLQPRPRRTRASRRGRTRWRSPGPTRRATPAPARPRSPSCRTRRRSPRARKRSSTTATCTSSSPRRPRARASSARSTARASRVARAR